jgi:hypothetical protein
MVLKLGNFGKYIRNAWKVLKCGAAEGWEDQLDRLCEKLGSITESQGGEEYHT